MTDSQQIIHNAARALAALAPALDALEAEDGVRAVCEEAVARGYFTPEEDDALREWFARYLTTRAGLHAIVNDLRPLALAATDDSRSLDHLRGFVLAYATACLLIRAARFLVYDLAEDRIVQRKLNEAEARFRISRKQYSLVYRSLTRPAHLWRLWAARSWVSEHREEIGRLADDPEVGEWVRRLETLESSVRVRKRKVFLARLRYRWHSYRRRRASAVQRALFAVLEGSGRVIADIKWPWHRDRVTRSVQGRLAELLEPGDIVVTRHDRVASNLFLPGYWPHAALHLGPESIKPELGIGAEHPRAAGWVEPLRVLEARKDGVLFRPLDDTLAVDSVTILRPQLPRTEIGRALARAIEHEGKLYNFDFDFFRSDRLVCTEVVYRAYDGVGDLTIPLTRRSGRLTLSAEDLVGLALAGEGFEPVAVYGAPGARRRIRTGERARKVLRRLRKRFG